jgi:hypothetical protein
VPCVEYKLLTLTEQLSSPPIFMRFVLVDLWFSVWCIFFIVVYPFARFLLAFWDLRLMNTLCLRLMNTLCLRLMNTLCLRLLNTLCLRLMNWVFISRKQRVFISRKQRVFISRKQRVFISRKQRVFISRKQRVFISRDEYPLFTTDEYPLFTTDEYPLVSSNFSQQYICLYMMTMLIQIRETGLGEPWVLHFSQFIFPF